MWPDLRDRHREPELMDDPSLPAADHDAALRGLARLNFVARSHAILWPRLALLARASNRSGRPLRVLDVATGSGDLPLAMAHQARELGLDIRWAVCDVSTHALEVARRRAAEAGFEFAAHQLDATNEELPATDVSICSLFVHHLDPPKVIGLLRGMRCASTAAIGIADLNRSRWGLTLAWLASRTLTCSPIVHTDALLSVRAAFRPSEIMTMAQEAGLRGAMLRRAWPARWHLWWSAP
jgi:2-polyprenyl-3-methyl-5-hydroxy-6-metoxy-1,4-benzoquinol methylase